MINQGKIMLIESRLCQLGGDDDFHQTASWIQNVVVKYVKPEMQNDFLDDLYALLNGWKNQ